MNGEYCSEQSCLKAISDHHQLIMFARHLNCKTLLQLVHINVPKEKWFSMIAEYDSEYDWFNHNLNICA